MRHFLLLAFVGVLTPAALAQGSVYSQILAVSGNPHETEWSDGARQILLAQYDRNRSGMLDTGAEVDAVACGAWEALQDAVLLGILPIYGFDPDYGWAGGSVEQACIQARLNSVRAVDPDCLPAGGSGLVHSSAFRQSSVSRRLVGGPRRAVTAAFDSPSEMPPVDSALSGTGGSLARHQGADREECERCGAWHGA